MREDISILYLLLPMQQLSKAESGAHPARPRCRPCLGSFLGWVLCFTQVRSLGWEDPLDKETATHSSILAWRIPWTEEPGGL